ncbi:hypothetical protein FS749_001535 [Ceratobasidium sp. UAMH 11750]|nr:hypothetical protein FS749_001535 [Ceratobasidium sp. UAMH 11750]
MVASSPITRPRFAIYPNSSPINGCCPMLLGRVIGQRLTNQALAQANRQTYRNRLTSSTVQAQVFGTQVVANRQTCQPLSNQEQLSLPKGVASVGLRSGITVTPGSAVASRSGESSRFAISIEILVQIHQVGIDIINIHCLG